MNILLNQLEYSSVTVGIESVLALVAIVHMMGLGISCYACHLRAYQVPLDIPNARLAICLRKPVQP